MKSVGAAALGKSVLLELDRLEYVGRGAAAAIQRRGLHAEAQAVRAAPHIHPKGGTTGEGRALNNTF